MTDPWTITFYLVRQDKPEPDHRNVLTCIFCGKGNNPDHGAGDGLAVEWEFGYRPEGTGTLRASGLCDRCRVQLKAFVPREVAPSEPKPEPDDTGVIRAAEATDEILACTMPEPSDDAKRLNPFLDSEAKRPDGPLALFIWGIRYYAGMLEDDDNWSHALGHIEECCAEFQLAIDKRREPKKP